jgi:hypothetical protein|tara:strand:+ start:1492 stop:1638 length:147 start_codon:yes stop_codon:yes gene_type:complete
MAKDYTPIDTNKSGHKFYSEEDIEAGAVCDCRHCAVPKKAAKKEEKKE